MISLIYSIVPESEVSDQQLMRLIDQLPSQEKQRIMKLKQKQDRILSAYGLLMLKGVVGDISNLKRNDFGKPFLDSAMNFSISHSGKIVVCAYTESTQLGLDVEEVKNIDISDFHLVMTKEEIQKTNSLTDFYKLWTQKEAIIKAVGKGFSIDAKEISLKEAKCSFEGQSWILSRVHTVPGYECHIAHKEEQEIAVKEFFISAEHESQFIKM